MLRKIIIAEKATGIEGKEINKRTIYKCAIPRKYFLAYTLLTRLDSIFESTTYSWL